MQLKEEEQLRRKRSDVMECKEVSVDSRSSGAGMVLKVVLR